MNTEPLRGEIEKLIELRMQEIVTDLYAFLQDDPTIFPSSGSISTSGRVSETSKELASQIMSLVENVCDRWMIQHVLELEYKVRQELKRRRAENVIPASAVNEAITDEDVRQYELGYRRDQRI
jgi:hypothetical protein